MTAFKKALIFYCAVVYFAVVFITWDILWPIAVEWDWVFRGFVVACIPLVLVAALLTEEHF